MRLTTVAADVLRDPSGQPAHVGVAVATLSAAVRERIEVPSDAAAILWLAIEHSPASPWASDASEAVGLIADRSLVERIVATVTQHDVSRELRAAGLDALGDPKAAKHLTDGEVLALVEVATGRAQSDVASVVHGVSEGRHLDHATVSRIVDRWVSSSEVHARHAALQLIELLPRDAAAHAMERLLIHDPTPKIREEAAAVIDVLLDPQSALLLIDTALGSEAHAEVRSALARAKAEVVGR